MRAIGIVIIGLALVLAGAVFFIVPRFMRGPPQQQIAAAAPPPTKEVLVAAHYLSPGTALKPEDLRFQKWPVDAVEPNYLMQDKGANPKNEAGLIVLHDIDAGEPVMASQLLHSGEGSFLAAVLPPGMRAITIQINQLSATNGFILPGDHVDVLMTEHYAFPASPDEKLAAATLPPLGDKEFVSVVLRDVKVLAIDNVTHVDALNRPGGTATLEVDLQDAQKLTIVNNANLGALSLLLRSHQLPSHPEAEGTPTIVEDYQVSPLRAALEQQYLTNLAELRGGGEGGGGAALRIYHGAALAPAQ
jgi:pilus assembly protein CpaB